MFFKHRYATRTVPYIIKGNRSRSSRFLLQYSNLIFQTVAKTRHIHIYKRKVISLQKGGGKSNKTSFSRSSGVGGLPDEISYGSPPAVMGRGDLSDILLLIGPGAVGVC